MGDGGSGSATDMPPIDNTCPLPQLLVTIADVSNSSNLGGQVARFTLPSTFQCSTLKAMDLIGAGITVSTYLPPHYIVTSDQDTVYAVDSDSDTLAWSKQAASSGRTWAPLEAFPMKDGSGRDVAAVAFGLIGSNPNEMTEVDAWHADGSTVGNSPWCMSGSGCGTGSDLMLGLGVLGVAANPRNPSHFFAVDNSNNLAAVDVNPFVPSKSTFITGNTEYLQVAYAISFGGKMRLAWLDATPPTAVAYYNDTGGTPSISGPLRCSSGCQTLLRVVPDPLSATAFFALCDGTGINGRSVVHLQNDGSCATVFDGKTLSASYRLQHIAIAQ
jgi:hypothetical protein